MRRRYWSYERKLHAQTKMIHVAEFNNTMRKMNLSCQNHIKTKGTVVNKIIAKTIQLQLHLHLHRQPHNMYPQLQLYE